MAAAAVTAGAPRALTARRRATSGLAFDEPGGPLVAVCGLAGGAGTTTIAMQLARRAAAASAAPVLLIEGEPGDGGLAVAAGHATPHTLHELAEQLADQAALTDAFLELEAGLRLVAVGPQARRLPAPAAAVSALLVEARAAHGLVVVDCATTWTVDAPILKAATHILWCAPATPAGLAKTQSAFGSDRMPAPGRAIEALIATALQPRARVSARALRRSAGARCERLILIPHSDAIARGEHDADGALQHALLGLAPILRRTR